MNDSHHNSERPENPVSVAAVSDARPIVLSGQMTGPESRQCFELMVGRQIADARLRVLLVFLLGIVMLGIAFSQRSQLGNSWMILAIPPILLIVLWTWKWFKTNRATRMGGFPPARIEVSNKGTAGGFGPTLQAFVWTDFSRQIAHPEVVLLVMQDGKSFIPLFQRMLEEPSRWQEMLNLINAKLPATHDA